jgi:hypothetical protein
MKKLLLILMVLASAVYAQTKMSDAEMKKLLVGTWVSGENSTERFTSDGRWFGTEPRFPNEAENGSMGWDIKNGELIQIRGGGESARPYPIIFLTAHECLLHWAHHGGGYALWTR